MGGKHGRKNSRVQHVSWDFGTLFLAPVPAPGKLSLLYIIIEYCTSWNDDDDDDDDDDELMIDG